MGVAEVDTAGGMEILSVQLLHNARRTGLHSFYLSDYMCEAAPSMGRSLPDDERAAAQTQERDQGNEELGQNFRDHGGICRGDLGAGLRRHGSGAGCTSDASQRRHALGRARGDGGDLEG
ncbi:hypothetical protein NOVOSPHI9U_40168 [Novosphingobium sp. 9U]|nr:hypothetical protein NOVOSPHI9U_40168 [Novosphingobium sp. 9U]